MTLIHWLVTEKAKESDTPRQESDISRQKRYSVSNVSFCVATALFLIIIIDISDIFLPEILRENTKNKK